MKPTSMDRDSADRRSVLAGNPLAQYERLVEIRVVEDRVVELYGEGEIEGTIHTCQGQEAVAVGVASATKASDVFACTYRGHGHALALGMTPKAILAEIMGRTIGCTGGLGGSMHLADRTVGLLPTSAIIGSGIPIAVGAGLSAQMRGTDGVAVSVFGDGAANIGAFHEGLNLAAVWRLPVVFVCENNLYGEYSRIETTTPISDIATRGAAYGMPSEVVDGQDVVEVESAMARAVSRARAQEGPTLLEMKTYRFSGHSRSDKALYRPTGELEQWQDRDPLIVHADRLAAIGGATADELETMRQAIVAAVDGIIGEVGASEKPGPERIFANIFAETTPGEA